MKQFLELQQKFKQVNWITKTNCEEYVGTETSFSKLNNFIGIH